MKLFHTAIKRYNKLFTQNAVMKSVSVTLEYIHLRNSANDTRHCVTIV